MDASGASSPLSAADLDLTNETVALAYLASILDDSELQVKDNEFSKAFWYGIVAVIGIATMFNIIQRVTLMLRLRAAAANRPQCSNGVNKVARFFSTGTTLFRVFSYPQLSPGYYVSMIKIPPFGIIIMLLTYLGFILALEFINVHVDGDQGYEALGLRATWLSMAQMPLLILLAGKNNLIGYMTGLSYERLNVMHRWVARCLLLTATFHFAYQSYGWNRLGLMQLEWASDSCTPTGMAAYAILLWINLSTLAPFRNLAYEFFVVQHILTFLGLIVAIMLHIPTTALHARVYIWIPIGLYLLDRATRCLRYLYNNCYPGKAVITSRPGDVTMVRIKSRQVKQWSPGAFVLLSIPRFGILQSHPATIASIPSSHDGDLLFFLRAHKGFTRRILSAAEASKGENGRSLPPAFLALIDGPYGAAHADFAGFDTTILIAGGTGVTFTLSVLMDLAHRAATRKLPLRALRFLWVIRSAVCTEWIEAELKMAADRLYRAGVEVSVRVYVTRDGLLVEEDEQPECLNEKTPPANANVPSISNSEMSSKSQTSSEPPLVHVVSGRPDFQILLSDASARAHGEMGVAVSGPISLTTSVKMQVASLAVKNVVNGKGPYLHSENFGW